VKKIRLLSVLILFVLLGCSTTPPRDAASAAAWLGGEPRVLVRIDALQVKAWKEITSARESLRPVGGRTRTVWLGFDLDRLDGLKTAADTVHIVLEGDFPKGLAGLALDWDASWKKGPIAGVWTNQKLNLSLSLPEDGLVAAYRGVSPPEKSTGVLRDLDPKELSASAVWISFWSPGQALFGPAGARLLPVERLDVILSSQGDLLVGPLVLWFTDERAAAAATVLLKLFAPQIRSRLGQDLEWSLDGLKVVGTMLQVKQSDLRDLAEKLVADDVPPPKNEAAP
jgi:hypothetical protein